MGFECLLGDIGDCLQGIVGSRLWLLYVARV